MQARLGDLPGGRHPAGDGGLRFQPAEVHQGEQRLGAHHHGQVPAELGQRLGVGPGQRAGHRGERVVDQPEPVPGPAGRGGRLGDRGGDHGPDGALVAQHPAQQEVGRVSHPLHRVRAVRDRREGLRGVGPSPFVSLSQQAGQVGEVAVGRGLRDQRLPGHGGHADLDASAGQPPGGVDDCHPGALLLVLPATRCLPRLRSRPGEPGLGSGFTRRDLRVHHSFIIAARHA